MITVYNMDVRKALSMIPDESVDAQITSPPYWALRDYGEDTEIVWDGGPNCKHEFGKRIKMKNRHKKGETNPGKEAWYKEKGAISQVAGNFCKKCNAWKGQLGLEPDFKLYMKHLLDIFDQVKRVLRKDGLCWVNLADTYSGNMGKRSGWTDNKLGFTKEEALEKGVCLNRKFSYSLPQKCLCGIPERFMLGMIERGWILRNKIIWYKRNSLPSSVKDRLTTKWEYLFFFSKSKRYYFDLDAIREPIKSESLKRRSYGYSENVSFNYRKRLAKQGRAKDYMIKATPEEIKTYDEKQYKTKQDLAHQRQGSYDDSLHTKPVNPKGKNPGDMWDITTQPFRDAHFAVFPEKLVERPIKVTRKDSVILDIFAGSGTTLKVARDLGREAVGIEIKKEYCDIIFKRLFSGNKRLANEFKLIR